MILIVEDEPEIAELMRFHLEREGFDVRIAGAGRVAIAAAEKDIPALILLDLMLPDLDGLEICRRLKWNERTRAVPVLIVSAKGEESDVVAGLELGAEDYITKPFSPKVLLARVKRVLRRPADDAEALAKDRDDAIQIADGALAIDSDRHIVTVNRQPIELTVTEFGILEYLAAEP